MVKATDRRDAAAPAVASDEGRRRLVLPLIALGGGAIRVIYDLAIRHQPRGFDAIAYVLMSKALRDGTGYVRATSLFAPERRPTAAFAPGYVAYRAVWGGLAGWEATPGRLSGVLPAMVTILLTGLLARRLLSRRAGWVAAAAVAVDPTLVAVDGSGMAENLSVMLVAAALWLTVRTIDVGVGWASAVGLGGLSGAAMLTRPDLLLLLPLLVVPIVLVGGSPGRARRALFMALAVVVAVAVVVPWAWRNHRVLGTFTIATTSPASSVAGSNCDQTYYGRSVGSFDFDCVQARELEGVGEADQAAHFREASAEYTRRHLSRVPLVLAARELRVWGIWDPRDQIDREVEESRSRPWQRLAWPVRLVTVVVGAAGLALLVRERRRAAVLLAPVVVAMASAGLSYGNPRFAAIAQPVLAIGIAFVAQRWWRRRNAGRRAPGSEGVPVGSTA